MADPEIADLEREIAERMARLKELRDPMTADECRDLARTDPDEFNRRFDAGLIPASALGATPKEGS